MSDEIKEPIEGAGKIVEMKPIIESPEELKARMDAEMKVLDEADKIKAERNEKLKAEEELIKAELKEKFGLDVDSLQACKDLEKSLGDPELKITTLSAAIQHYKDAGLTADQYAFMAVNSNSRANLYANELNYLENEIKNLNTIVSQLQGSTAPAEAHKQPME